MDVCTRACSCMQRNPGIWDLEIFQKTPLGNSFVDDEENLLKVALSCTDLATGLYHQFHCFEHPRSVQFCLLHPKQWQTLVGVQVWLDFHAPWISLWCTMCWFTRRIWVCLVKTSVHESYTAHFWLVLSCYFFSLSLKSTSDRKVCTYQIIISYISVSFSYFHIQPTFSELETLVPEILAFSQDFILKEKSEIWERTCTHWCL